ncbi:hypothetical protein QBC32DRAFT_377046 [Pseudoneurospora amorphoporcata]|uniref:N-acetyltransferase domain-containing protein n=1 Tax=Pseudoneurospora amorphoporcata TaxID=241081 RepID=A0AAN6P0X4_9PEZI|nr:hypothetical protein QBC32DRAFT_377046 [Pseudoneurospora amorphoporcata]
MSSPTALPPRYQIRKLTLSDLPFAHAIITHANLFHNAVWSRLHASDAVERSYRVFNTGAYNTSHGIESGFSYGILDTEYQYKRPESAATNGAVYWDPELHPASSGQDLLEQMDFPLVSVALAYDPVATPLDMVKFQLVFDALPLFPKLVSITEAHDIRPPEERKPKEVGECLFRCGTATRADYEGKGLARALAAHLMTEAKKAGFKATQVGTVNNRLNAIWERVPGQVRGVEGAKSRVVSVVDLETYEEEEVREDGKVRKVNPFLGAKVVRKCIYVTL